MDVDPETSVLKTNQEFLRQMKEKYPDMELCVRTGIYPVSYTHLDVYKRQGFYWFQGPASSGGSEKSGCSCAGDHHRRRYPELFCKQKESVLNRFFFYALSHNIHNNEHV